MRGYKLEDLLNMGFLERQFLYYARLEHYNEEAAKYKALRGVE
ncbi:hypothetical protein BJV38_004974 [Clostridium beijerinckii]|nr:hypothetical protein [Clostridium beijerinckii]NRT48131.1 hypothetical protein [Clostridium beijerinckii]NRZ23572.1 hypothetical protein [Clostridium beijerinckii]